MYKPMTASSWILALVLTLALVEAALGDDLVNDEPYELTEDEDQGQGQDRSYSMCPYHPACWISLYESQAPDFRRSTRMWRGQGHLLDAYQNRFNKKARFHAAGVRLTKRAPGVRLTKKAASVRLTKRMPGVRLTRRAPEIEV